MEKGIKKLIESWQSSAAKMYAGIKAHYSQGIEITWERGYGRIQHGFVILVFGDRLKVQNGKTGKEYWISIHDVR